MHRKKVLAGLFLTAGLALTLLTPRNVRADDVLPGGSAVTADDTMADQGIEDLLLITPEELSVSISPGSPETPAADEDSGERSEQAHSAQETDPGADIEQEMDPGGDIAQETGEQGGPDDPADPTDPAQPADPHNPHHQRSD